ncbi:cytosine permease [Bacillus sp. FJAT-42376]|uniref:purine-cytosine permease family protein n=1 Tax=Bacillus sp. FJAT-42376 TaxID=2014076 RepID=UPI000F507FFD|nr:cytosine permease [Bacillus sp. FJAT-42376]AZB43924.1 cytosine permease [Bacillus sp. FJAT-42376]
MIPIEKKPLQRLERFGLEAVPAELRKTGWVEYFIIQFTFSFNAGNVLLPALAVMEGGLRFSEALLSCLAGAFFAFLLVSFLSLPGSLNGLPAQYALRTILGSRLSQYAASPVRSLISVYWFSVQTIGGTWMIIESLKRFGVQHVPFSILAAGLGAVMIGITVIGFHAVKKATAYFLPVLLAGEGIILYLYFTTNTSAPASVSTQAGGASEGHVWTMLLFASLVFVQYVAGVSASADMTRYAKSPNHGFWGMFAGNFIGFSITAFLGIFSAVHFSEVNPFLSASKLTGSTALFSIILAASVLSLISINLSNAYTGSFSLLNIFPALGRIKSAVLFGSAGIILSTIPSIVTEAKVWITMLGSLSIPLSAVITSDFLIVKRRRISEMDLLSMRQVNRDAVLSMASGILLYWVIPSGAAPGFISFICTFLLYTAITKFRKKRLGQKVSS